MDSLTLDEVKLYLRVDHTIEDKLIEDLMKTAEDKIITMTGKTKRVLPDGMEISVQEDVQFKQAARLLIAHWYENRAVFSPTAVNKINYSVEQLTNDIAISGDYI